MPSAIHGSYINLERSTDRAQAMQAQLTRLGMDWVQRHGAVDGAAEPVPAGIALLAGEYGCFRSHLQLLERASDEAYTLVLEDDAELSPELPGLLAAALRDDLLAGSDMVFLECQTHPTLAHISPLWDIVSRWMPRPALPGQRRQAAGVELVDAQPFYKWGAVAYVVSPAGRAKLVALMRRWLAEGTRLPLDRCFERAIAAGEIKASITVPFLASPQLRWYRSSTIRGEHHLPPNALTILRRLLFSGSLDGLEALAQPLAAARADLALDLFALVLREVAALQRLEAGGRARS